jgi:hypothetical protein
VLYLWLIIFSVEGDVLIDSETLLLIDFVNLNIKPTQWTPGRVPTNRYSSVLGVV